MVELGRLKHCTPKNKRLVIQSTHLQQKLVKRLRLHEFEDI